MLFDRETLIIHVWIECVVLGFHPFSSVESETFRRHLKYGSICRKKIIANVDKLIYDVEAGIEADLPNLIAIVSDGWSSGSTHFVGVFATYPYDNITRYDQAFFAFSPLENEAVQDAAEHVDVLEFVLQLFGKEKTKVDAIIGDNANVNRALARELGCRFVGCHSHRFKLAIKEILGGHFPIIDRVQLFMEKLSCNIPATLLRPETRLAARLRSVTRWRSTFKMLSRYVEIMEVLPRIDPSDMLDLLLSDVESAEIKQLLSRLELIPLQWSSKAAQRCYAAQASSSMV